MTYIYSVAVFLFLLLSGCASNPGEELSDIKNSSAKVNNGIINDEIQGVPVVVYADEYMKLFSSFERRYDKSGDVLNFEYSRLGFPDILQDQYGNIWDVFGNCISGSLKGNKLQKVKSLVGYWFFFPSFFDHINLYNGVSIVQNQSLSATNSDWLIDKKRIYAGTFKDAIKSIDNPKFLELPREYFEDSFYSLLSEDELTTVVVYDNVAQAYPHKILEYHEVVNDEISGLAIAVSFCPLTGTSKVWEREIEGVIHEFGVSGLLYNSNLIMYDRKTGSNWSQILDQAVNGTYMGLSAKSLQIFEMRIGDLINMKVKVRLLSTATGIDYDYFHPLYGDYAVSNRVSYPLRFIYHEIPPKERVIGVTVDEYTKVYRFGDFINE